MKKLLATFILLLFSSISAMEHSPLIEDKVVFSKETQSPAMRSEFNPFGSKKEELIVPCIGSYLEPILQSVCFGSRIQKTDNYSSIEVIEKNDCTSYWIRDYYTNILTTDGSRTKPLTIENFGTKASPSQLTNEYIDKLNQTYLPIRIA